MTAPLELYPEELEPTLPIEVDSLEVKHRKRLGFSGTDHAHRGNIGGRKFVELPTKRAWSQPISVPLAELEGRDKARMRREGEVAVSVGFMDYLEERETDSQ